jgi:solute carrier family 25 (mitochondrial folate transporter), member 32
MTIDKPLIINFWSSIIAGACSTVVTNPIWVIKTRLMSQSSIHNRAGFSVWPKGSNTPTSRPTLHAPWHYTSTLDAARKMYTTEGVLSFYSGLAPALLGLTHVAVQFPAYEWLRTKFTGEGMGQLGEDGDTKSHWFGILSASILSKIMASSATYPHEVIRTRLQTQRRPAPGQEYLEGFGIVAKDPAENGKSTGSGSNGSSNAKGGTALPPKYRGLVRTFRTILHEEGWRAFYAGMGTNMMRAVPAATVTMVTYEYVMRQLNQKRNDARQKMHRL